MPLGSVRPSGFFGGPIIAADEDPVPGSTGIIEDDDEDEPSIPSWSSAQPLDFYRLRDIVISLSGLDIDAGTAARILNSYGQSFYANNNGRWPTYDDLRGDDGFWRGLQRQALRVDLFPAFFGVQGASGVTWYQNNGQTLIPVEAPQGAFSPTGGDSGDTLIDGWYDRGNPPPIYGEDEFNSIINFDALGTSRGGSGGGGRAAPVWDRGALEEAIHSIWRPLMLEEAPAGLINEYVTQATAFGRQGGSLNLEAWVLGKMRGTSKYQVIYGRKDPSMSEGEWIGQYRQIAASTGIRADLVSRETIRGASSGAAPAAFANSLEESRDVQAIGTGDLSRRFASVMAGIPS